jgi:hypothetical protein
MRSSTGASCRVHKLLVLSSRAVLKQMPLATLPQRCAGDFEDTRTRRRSLARFPFGSR